MLNCRSPARTLSYLEGCHPNIPRGQIHRMCGAAKEMGHHVVSREAIRAGGVIGPDYGVGGGLDPQAVAGTELEEGAKVGPRQQLLGWVNWGREWP